MKKNKLHLDTKQNATRQQAGGYCFCSARLLACWRSSQTIADPTAAVPTTCIASASPAFRLSVEEAPSKNPVPVAKLRAKSRAAMAVGCSLSLNISGMRAVAAVVAPPCAKPSAQARSSSSSRGHTNRPIITLS